MYFEFLPAKTTGGFLLQTSRCAPSPPRRTFPGGFPPGPPRTPPEKVLGAALKSPLQISDLT